MERLEIVRQGIRFLRGGYEDQATAHEASRHEREALKELEQLTEIVNAAVAWREADESEPIGSKVPNEKLLGLAMAIDKWRET